MKKIFLLAALALTMAACSNEDNITEQPADIASPEAGIPFTATITTGGATRALSGPDGDGKIQAAWAENEEVALVYEVGGTTKVTKAIVKNVSDGTDGKTAGTATINATLETGVANGDDITLIYPYSMVNTTTGKLKDDAFTGQNGTLTGDGSISAKYDLRKGTGKIYYNGTDDATLKDNVTMASQIAIWQLTLNFGADGTPVSDLSTGKTLTISVGDKTYTIESEFNDGTSTVGGGGYRAFKSGDVIYVAMLPCDSKPFSISTIKGSNELYLYQHSNLSLAAGTYYKSPVVMDKIVPNVTITSAHTNVALVNGDIVTGTGGTATHITIADGATVTLYNLTNTAINHAGETPYAGIECKGDAHIILLGSNSVKGVWSHAGISVPEGKTLTISGGGSLTATGDGGAAGIGGNKDASCGAITIMGGTVNAEGADHAAGIGGGLEGTCGAITIGGSTNVTATGGKFAAGIGSGHASNYAASCGAITIGGSTNVTATGGKFAAGIGSGNGNNNSGNPIVSSCGAISISGGTVEATGGTNAAGIGSGDSGTSGAISISGGTVEATGGSDAAGIGSGRCGKFESINITSGITSVIAKRVNVLDNAPVGKGYLDQGSGTVTISDQTLTFEQQIGTNEMPASFAGVTVVKSDYESSYSYTFKTLTITKNP